MASKKIETHLKIALKEIGTITPWFDKESNSWIFSHNLYPVEYGGDSPEEVIQNYPLYLKEFIKHRLESKLSPIIEKQTSGRGGKREGAGRPKGTVEEKVRIYLPKDLASFLKEPFVIEHLRGLLQAYHGK